MMKTKPNSIINKTNYKVKAKKGNKKKKYHKNDIKDNVVNNQIL